MSSSAFGGKKAGGRQRRHWKVQNRQIDSRANTRQKVDMYETSRAGLGQNRPWALFIAPTSRNKWVRRATGLKSYTYHTKKGPFHTYVPSPCFTLGIGHLESFNCPESRGSPRQVNISYTTVIMIVIIAVTVTVIIISPRLKGEETHSMCNAFRHRP